MDQGFTLNPLDIIIVVVVGIGLYVGSKRGAIKGLTRMVTIIVSAVAGFRLRWIMEWLLQDSMNLGLSQQSALLLSFILAFVVVYVLVGSLLGMLTKGLKSMNLGVNFDNALGALLGGTIATLMLSIAFVGLSFFNFPTAENARGSVLYPQVRTFAKNVLGAGFNVMKDLQNQMNHPGGAGTGGDNTDTQPAPQVEKPRPIR